MHTNSYQRITQFVEKYLDPTTKLTVIDFGSYDVNGTFKPLFDQPNWEYIGVDINPGPNVDFVLTDPYTLPWKDETIDVVVSGSTMEHVKQFWVTIKEIGRILRPNGLFLLELPGATNIIHRHPVDCWRFLPDCIDVLAEIGSFNILEQHHDRRTPWQDVTAVLQKKIVR